MNNHGIPDCSCLRVRRASRRLTRFYDRILEPAGFTVSQVGLLACLQATAGAGRSLSELAAQLGMDYSTLNRKLKPLVAQGLVVDGTDASDGRRRIVHITAAGAGALKRALPLWQRAQATLERTLGGESAQALNAVLDLAAAKFKN